MLRAFLDGRVFGEQDGDAPPRIIALHGWARDRRDFAGVLDDFGGIRLDLPGFGSSPTPTVPPTPARVAELLAPLVEALEPPRIVVGHSFGGRVGVHLAAESLGIGHLILVGTPLMRAPSPSKPKASYQVVRKAHSMGLISDAALEWARQRYGSADYRAATGVMREALVAAVSDDYRTKLPAIRCPVSLVTGEFDTAAPPAVQVQAARLLSTATVTVLHGSGHLIEEPHKSAVRNVLAGVIGR